MARLQQDWAAQLGAQIAAEVAVEPTEVLDRVKARDEKGAATAMLAHLEQTARDLRAAFTLTGLQLGPEPAAGEPGQEATA